jgi:geranylgeranyl diphosphate synthase, type I
MNLNQYRKKNKKKIEQEIINCLSRWRTEMDKKNPDLKSLTQLLFESNISGKNIRGILVCLGYELFAKQSNRDIYKIAAAYEILHSSLLIHDDVIDKSPLRRGRQTVFQQLGGEHYGISQAICLGDVGFFLATQALSETSFKDSVKVAAISQFSQIVLDTISGQMLDIHFSNKISRVTESDIIKIADLKTAQYTISGPLIIGAVLAGANKKYIKYLAQFGEKLGIAFQIKDDMLGTFGNEETVGKSVTSDIEEGKNTLLIQYAINQASKEQKKMLLKYYGKGKITANQHVMIKKIFQETGAYAYSERIMQQYVKDASVVITQLSSNKDKVLLLNSLVEFLISREK